MRPRETPDQRVDDVRADEVVAFDQHVAAGKARHARGVEQRELVAFSVRQNERPGMLPQQRLERGRRDLPAAADAPGDAVLPGRGAAGLFAAGSMSKAKTVVAGDSRAKPIA